MTENLEALQKVAGGFAAREILGREEVIVDAVALAGPGRTRRGRDARHQARAFVVEPLEQRRLAGAGRARDDDKPAGFRLHIGPGGGRGGRGQRGRASRALPTRHSESSRGCAQSRP